MTTIIRMREERRGGTVAVILDGEIDTSTVGDVAVKLRQVAENRLHRIVIDLSAVTYLDSAGINLLYAVSGEVQARQQQLNLVVSPGSPIERMLQIVGADRTFPVYPTLDEALAAG